MKLDKNSLRADALANLYRAALYLAQDDQETGLDFLKKAQEVLGSDLKTPDTSLPHLILAEKVLDQYHLLKANL